MADFSFERISVLVAEDNSYMRQLIGAALHAFGVGTIKEASDGGEAIELLRLMSLDPRKAGIGAIDIVFTNWQMSPVDGGMLVRWIRRHAESPNRFMPVVMITAHADRSRVAEARDLGVTEFLAKPFSMEAVAQRLLQVVERPRQFVQTASYFGPDRRRRAMAFDGTERRRLGEGSPEVEVIYD